MNQETIMNLRDDLEDANTDFNNIISRIQEIATYPVDDLVKMENQSYRLSYDAIIRMNAIYKRYSILRLNNAEFFEKSNMIVFKYISLYLVSIIMMIIFSKTLSQEKINEIWYAIVGLVLGSANATLIHTNLDNHHYGDPDSRALMNEITTLEEEYSKNFEVARKEIEYMFSLNRNLDKERIDTKKLTKKLKDMH